MGHADKIILKGMRFYGFHGYLAAEQELGQWFEIDIQLSADIAVAGEKDDIEQTVDYSKLYAQVKSLVEGPPVALIETLAIKTIDVCFSFPQVQKAKVTVKKPQAPLGGPLAYSAVQMTRRRKA